MTSNYLGEPKIITGVPLRRSKDRGQRKYDNSSRKKDRQKGKQMAMSDTTQLALEREEEAKSQGTQAASCSWTR